jgi:hypothetical protein
MTDSTIPLTVAIPMFDYSRSLAFSVDFRRDGNRLLFDATAVHPLFYTTDYRIPEDYPKEYVHSIGTLPPGTYTVTARYFDIQPLLDESNMFLGNPSYEEIDFAQFRREPLIYQPPDGFALSMREENVAFTVVPEPTLSCLPWLAGMGLFRRRFRSGGLALRGSLRSTTLAISRRLSRSGFVN